MNMKMMRQIHRKWRLRYYQFAVLYLLCNEKALATLAPTLSIEPSVAPSLNPTPRATSPPTLLPTSRPTPRPTPQPTSSPTLAPSKMPTISPSVIPTNGPSEIPSVQPTIYPTMIPSRIPTTPPSASPTRLTPKQFSFEITLEIPGQNQMNQSQVTAYEEVVFNTLKSSSCRSTHVQVSSVQISNQTPSLDGQKLYFDLNIGASLFEHNYNSAKGIIVACIEDNSSSIQNNYHQSVGYTGGSTTVNNKGTNPLILTSLILGSVIAAIGLVIFAMFFTQRRQQIVRRKKVEKIQELYGDLKRNGSANDHDVEGDLDEMSYESYHNEELHNELGDIEHLMSMVLDGPSEPGVSFSHSSRAVRQKKMIPVLIFIIYSNSDLSIFLFFLLTSC